MYNAILSRSEIKRNQSNENVHARLKILLHEIWKISADRKKLRSNRNSTVKTTHSAYLEVNTDRDLAAGECNTFELQIGRSRMLGWWIRLVTDRLVFRRFLDIWRDNSVKLVWLIFHLSPIFTSKHERVQIFVISRHQTR